MIYQVIMQDEYNNLECLGFYPTLDDALPDINNWLSLYDTSIDSLSEYPSTFSMCFDRDVDVEDCTVYIRGFILDEEALYGVVSSLRKA